MKTLESKMAPDFKLSGEKGESFCLSERCKIAPILLVFYPGDFTPVCTAQLCNYRDNFEAFKKYNIQIVGLSRDAGSKHQEFKEIYHFPFELLTDPNNEVAKLYGCTSKWLLGMVSRGVFIIDKNQEILYRHIEPTAVTKRNSEELLKVIEDLHSKGLV